MNAKTWILTCCALVLLYGQSLAQRQETLLGRARLVGAFGSALTEWGVNKDLGTSVGGGGGLVFENFFLGAYGMANVNLRHILQNNPRLEELNLAHTGLWLGFSVPSHKLVHLYGGARMGWGVLEIDFNAPDLRYDDLDYVAVVTPEGGIELNLTTWMRVAGSVGYRYLDGADSGQGYRNEDFRGAFYSLTFRVGRFGRFRDKSHGPDDNDNR